MTNPPRLAVFDLDGTLIDSVGDLTAALNKLLEELGRPPLVPSQVRTMVGDGAAVLVERALAARPGPALEPGTALARFLAFYEADSLSRTELFPGVAQTLDRLARSGMVLAVSTNKPERPSRRIIEALGLGHLFRLVVGGDTLPWRKPDPRMLTHVNDRTGIAAAETIFIGDSEVDEATSAAAEIPFVLMTYGYHRGPVERFRCKAALDRFAALEAVLLGA